MRIAHVSATFPPNYTGTANVCYHNARLLAERGHEVDVYTAKISATAEQQEMDGFGVRRLRCLFRAGYAFLLPGLLKLSGYDLVHLHYPFIFGAEMIWLNHHLQGQPYVLTYHNDLRGSGAKGSAFAIYERTWTQRILNGARKIFAPTWDFATSHSWLQPAISSGADRVLEVPNGVNTTIFHPDANGIEVRARHNVGVDVKHVLMFAGAMGSTHHLKGGVPVLLEALARLNDPTILLLLVGGGDRVSEYTALASRLGIHRQAIFVGPVPHERMPPYFAAADIVVQPSVSGESFGMVAVEAMACGKPIIASNLPGTRSVISNGVDGFLVPPGDADALAETIASLAGMPDDVRMGMGAAGRRKAETKYDWEQIGDQIERIYSDVLSDRVAVYAG